MGDLRDRLLTQPRKLNNAPTELGPVRSGYLDILPETTLVASGSVGCCCQECNVLPGWRVDLAPVAKRPNALCSNRW